MFGIDRELLRGNRDTHPPQAPGASNAEKINFPSMKTPVSTRATWRTRISCTGVDVFHRDDAASVKYSPTPPMPDLPPPASFSSALGYLVPRVRIASTGSHCSSAMRRSGLAVAVTGLSMALPVSPPIREVAHASCTTFVRHRLPPQSTMAAQSLNMPQLGIFLQPTPLHEFLAHLWADNSPVNKLTVSKPAAAYRHQRHYCHHPCPRFTVFTTTHHHIRLNSARALQPPRHITGRPPTRKNIEKSRGILMFIFHIADHPILREPDH